VGATDRTIRALRIESDYFADCIMNDKTPFNDGEAGLRVVRMLEAAEFPSEKGSWCACERILRNRAGRKAGKGVRLSKFINLYGCEIGDETKIGAFVESRKTPKWGGAAKFKSHIHLRRRGGLKTTFLSATA